MRCGVEKRSLRETVLGLAKYQDAEPRKNRCLKQRYDLPSICSRAFNSAQCLACRAILASSRSLCLSSYSKISLACNMVPATNREVWCVVGNRFLIANSKTKPISVVLPSVPRESSLGPPFLLIIRTIFASLVIRLYRLLMFVEAPVSWFLFRRVP